MNSPPRDPVPRPRDRNGHPVDVGARVRILKLSEKFLAILPDEEIDDVRSMIGEVFEVYEIDEYGSAWVGKGWSNEAGDRYHGHHIALEPEEMELVDDPPP